MYPIFFDTESSELDNLKERLKDSDLSMMFEFVPYFGMEIYKTHPTDFVFYFVRKNGGLKPDYAVVIKKKYPLSTIGCICAGDCHFTREISLASGADFFMVSVYEDFINDLEENIRKIEQKKFESTDINRDTFGLSKNELMLIRYLVSGLTEKQISERLCIGYESLKKKKRILLDKLNLKNHAELSIWAAFNICGLENIQVQDPLLKDYLNKRLK